MFLIDERNKIYLTKGDTASFTLLLEDGEGNARVPEDGDVFTFSIDDTDFSIEAVDSTFIIYGNDTKDLEAGVYTYRVVVTTKGQNFTIFQDKFIEILGGGDESER